MPAGSAETLGLLASWLLMCGSFLQENRDLKITEVRGAQHCSRFLLSHRLPPSGSSSAGSVTLGT